eukprot:12193803-Heterocapsa_arctica.AAC.1
MLEDHVQESPDCPAQPLVQPVTNFWTGMPCAERQSPYHPDGLRPVCGLTTAAMATEIWERTVATWR